MFCILGMPPADPPDVLSVAAVRSERFGRSHQLRVDIAITFSLLPAWLKRAISDRNDEKARSARAEIVERIAVAIERRFRITWHDSENCGDDALPIDRAAPLFGGPSLGDPHGIASGLIGIVVEPGGQAIAVRDAVSPDS